MDQRKLDEHIFQVQRYFQQNASKDDPLATFDSFVYAQKKQEVMKTALVKMAMHCGKSNFNKTQYTFETKKGRVLRLRCDSDKVIFLFLTVMQQGWDEMKYSLYQIQGYIPIDIKSLFKQAFHIDPKVQNEAVQALIYYIYRCSSIKSKDMYEFFFRILESKTWIEQVLQFFNGTRIQILKFQKQNRKIQIQTKHKANIQQIQRLQQQAQNLQVKLQQSKSKSQILSQKQIDLVMSNKALRANAQKFKDSSYKSLLKALDELQKNNQKLSQTLLSLEAQQTVRLNQQMALVNNQIVKQMDDILIQKDLGGLARAYLNLTELEKLN